jgi:hypothetical protein
MLLINRWLGGLKSYRGRVAENLISINRFRDVPPN